MFYTVFQKKKKIRSFVDLKSNVYWGICLSKFEKKKQLLAPFLFSSPPEKKNGYCRHSALSFIYEWRIYTVTIEKKTKTGYETDISSE